MITQSDSGSHNTYSAIVSMLKNTGYTKLAEYMKEYEDSRILGACAAAIIHKTKPDDMERILSQLCVIGAI